MNKDYQQHNLSKFINAIRSLLLKQNFFEHHLYSTLNYKIENTDTFEIKKDLYLRYNPEPDIWQVGKMHDKFFWIGSMFRNENKLDNLHQYEFTVVDVYQSNGTSQDVATKFIEILKTLEEGLKLPILSNLELKYISYKEFSETDRENLKGKYWLSVTDYPTNESFYDSPGREDGTLKFEIFLIDNGNPIEIAACGNLGRNLNKENYIIGEEQFINEELLKKNFIGFGIGLERLMGLYNQK